MNAMADGWGGREGPRHTAEESHMFAMRVGLGNSRHPRAYIFKAEQKRHSG